MPSTSLSRRTLMMGAAGLTAGAAMLGACASVAATTPSEPRFVDTNGVSLRTQAVGDPRHPAVLLVLGATAPMRFYADTFCARVAGAGRYVVRYDNRDTGRSTSFPAGAPGYTVQDLANDAVGILDAYKIE